MTTRISIITPSFNQARFLDQAMRSVLDQDHPALEYIVMDGGSTDGSADIIRAHAARLAYWVSEKDGGQSAAINQGLARSTGAIWAWMNADDAYLPGAVSKAAAWMEAHPEVDILYGGCRVIDEEGRTLSESEAAPFSIESMAVGMNMVPSGSTFLRRRVFERLGGLDESLHFVMDIDYWLRAAETFTFGFLPETLSLYRVHSDAKTVDGRRSEDRAHELIRIYERFWARPLQADLARLRPLALANVHLHAADLAAGRGDRRACLAHLKESLGHGPAALQPRFFRLLLNAVLGIDAGSALRKAPRLGSKQGMDRFV